MIIEFFIFLLMENFSTQKLCNYGLADSSGDNRGARFNVPFLLTNSFIIKQKHPYSVYV